MSIEDALAANTAAIKKQTEVLEALLAAGGGAKKGAATKTDEDPPKKTKGKAASLEDLRTLASGFLDLEEDDDKLPNRKKAIRELLTEAGVKTMKDIKPDDKAMISDLYTKVSALVDAAKEGDEPGEDEDDLT